MKRKKNSNEISFIYLPFFLPNFPDITHLLSICIEITYKKNQKCNKYRK